MIDTYRRILAWVGNLKGRVIAGFLLEIPIAIATAMPIFVAAWVLGQLVLASRGQARVEEGLIWLSLAAIAGCALVRAVFKFAKDTVQESIGYEKGADVRLAIGDVLKRVPLGYFEQVKTGDILSTVTTSLNTLELEAVRQADAALDGYIAAAIVALWMLTACPVAGIVVIAAIALVSFTLIAINRMARRLTPEARTATQRLSGAVIGLYNGLGTAKSYNVDGAVLRPYQRAVLALKDIRIRIEYEFTKPGTVHKLILGFASVALLVAAFAAFAAGQLELWMFMAISLFSTTIFGAIQRLADAAYMFADLDDSLDRIQDIESATYIDGEGRDIALESFGVEFDGVGFSYGERTVLHDVSFRIPEGATCAIVGPSGSGKTTISSLMARFYDVESGCVRVGGHDVREFTVDSLLKNFSMVFQDVYLFNDTIEANIAFGTEGATHEMVVEAAKRAQCHEFVSALPNGYETVVGKGGSTLSGGERQRISIARALLKNAPIVVLDEATASIDPENERLIQQALSELTAGKTVIVIAHRLATVEHADQILVVDGGTIAQAGTHAQLLEEEGLYRRFVEARAEAEGWRIGR